MTSWEELLVHLADGARENGTAALHRAAVWLFETLERSGAEVELFAFTATPWVLRLAGVIALAGGLLYWRLLRAGRPLLALAAALAVPALLLAQLEAYVPVFGWIGAETQHHVVARLAAPAAERRLLLTAHYDTKTDLLDHAERAPVEALALPVAALMLVGALAGWAAPRLRRGGRALRGLAGVAAAGAVLQGVATFCAFSAGAFVPAKSPGALDDGGSCAVLVKLAERLAAGAPLARTEVEVALLSAEEVGVQGSWVFARERFAGQPGLPTFVVNLEGLGASSQHAVLPSERFTLRSFAPDPRIVGLLDAAHRERFRRPLAELSFGGATDARSFLAHGIPAATLVSLAPGAGDMRGLHSAADDRSRVDVAALDASLAYLEAVVRRFDARAP